MEISKAKSLEESVYTTADKNLHTLFKIILKELSEIRNVPCNSTGTEWRNLDLSRSDDTRSSYRFCISFVSFHVWWSAAENQD